MFVNGDLKGKFIMDRNLGARDPKRSADGTGVAFYSFGRKDSFPGHATIGELATSAYKGRTGDVWTIDAKEQTQTTIATSVSKPMTFYGTLPGNWCTGVDSETYVWNDFEQDISANGKSIFDPSPKGWKVAPYGTMEKLEHESLVIYSDSENLGRGYPLDDEKVAYFPIQGWRYSSTGKMVSVTTVSGNWSSSPASTSQSYRIAYWINMVIYNTTGDGRSECHLIRPVLHELPSER